MKEPPPAQGGIQILGKGDGVDVPVNMLYKFLQLSEFLVPPVQFSTEYGTFQLCYRDLRTVQFLVCG